MGNRLKLSLGGVWLIASLSALIIPIFVPSYTNPAGFERNSLALSTVTLFLLSFPSSIVALPLLFMLYELLGVTTASITVEYFNVIFLFVLGLLQWFWMIPRLLSRPTFVQELDLNEAVGNTRLFTRDLTVWLDAEGATPLERVLVEDLPNREEDPR